MMVNKVNFIALHWQTLPAVDQFYGPATQFLGRTPIDVALESL